MRTSTMRPLGRLRERERDETACARGAPDDARWLRALKQVGAAARAARRARAAEYGGGRRDAAWCGSWALCWSRMQRFFPALAAIDLATAAPRTAAAATTAGGAAAPSPPLPSLASLHTALARLTAQRDEVDVAFQAIDAAAAAVPVPRPGRRVRPRPRLPPEGPPARRRPAQPHPPRWPTPSARPTSAHTAQFRTGQLVAGADGERGGARRRGARHEGGAARVLAAHRRGAAAGGRVAAGPHPSRAPTSSGCARRCTYRSARHGSGLDR